MSWTSVGLPILLSAVSLGDTGVTVEPMHEATLQRLAPAAGEAVCNVGNFAPPAWIVSGVLAPVQEYQIVFDPFAGCSDCIREGYHVNMVHIGLGISAPCEIVMDVGVGNVYVSEDPQCPLRGGELCSAGYYRVSLTSDGLWDIGIPLECPCGDVAEKKYLLSVYFQSIACEDESMPRLITEEYATPCENWLDGGDGWIDLVVADPLWPGDLSIWADAACCTSTAAKQPTWGTLKALYRR